MCKYVRLHKFLSLDRVQFFGLINDFLTSFFFDIRETTIVKNLTKKMTIFVRSTISLFNGGYIFFKYSFACNSDVLKDLEEWKFIVHLRYAFW